MLEKYVQVRVFRSTELGKMMLTSIRVSTADGVENYRRGTRISYYTLHYALTFHPLGLQPAGTTAGIRDE